MKIELLEKVLHDRQVYEAGEVRMVDDALGAHFCALGWARDADGGTATGERDTTKRVLTPDSVRHGVNSDEVGG